MSQLTCRSARNCWFAVDMYMQLSYSIAFLMCESLETTSEVTDDQEKNE